MAQTTQNKTEYNQIKQWCGKNAEHYKVFDTICGSTRKRQTETRELALKNDAVIVVGGRQSGNTRRLAQVAAQTHTPAFHIEDVSELDFSQLASASSIGITAGASTPNWIIMDTLAQVKKRLFLQHPILRWIYQFMGFLLKTNLLLAAGAASLSFACCTIQDAPNPIKNSVISLCYILSMQIINNIFIITSDRYNDPERASFYTKYKIRLGVLAGFSSLCALYLGFQQGMLYFFVLLLMISLGLSYNRMKMPGFLLKTTQNRKIKELPGSKTILIALAWGMVTSILPALGHDSSFLSVIFCFLYTAGIVFARTVFFDILAIQGDRIAGKETLPTMLGEKKS
ncbi:MAG: hydroxymethylbutenyl pyrophosphate reductase, partial [Desulfobacterales bacterium]